MIKVEMQMLVIDPGALVEDCRIALHASGLFLNNNNDTRLLTKNARIQEKFAL